MGRVITNGMSLAVAREASPGVLPASPDWQVLEPNAINTFGTTIGTTARSPISKSRARRKGKVTDLDSAVAFEADLTLQHVRLVMEAFLYSRAIGADVFPVSAVAGGGYTVPALSAAQGGRLQYAANGAQTLVEGSGFVNPANNGFKVLTADPVAGQTSIQVAGLVAEVPDPTTVALLAVCGIRGAAGDLKIDAQGNLTSTQLDFTTTGIARGQTIHVGGPDLIHQFATPSNFGFARVLAITANKLTLSKRDQVYAVDDGTSTGNGGTAAQIDILFGQYIRNVDVGSADYQEITSQFELASPNLMPGGATGYEYSIGNYANEISIAIPLTGKATITCSYVGFDTLPPNVNRATNSAQAKSGGNSEAFGTSSDIARIRAQDVDETGLTTDFKTATLSIKNGATAEKVLGKLGARYVNVGQFLVDMENQVLFTSPVIPARIRANATLGFDFALRNGDGGFAIDFPTGTMQGGNREYPVNASVLLNDTFAAHQEQTYGYTMGVSLFPVLPTPTA